MASWCQPVWKHYLCCGNREVQGLAHMRTSLTVWVCPHGQIVCIDTHVLIWIYLNLHLGLIFYRKQHVLIQEFKFNFKPNLNLLLPSGVPNMEPNKFWVTNWNKPDWLERWFCVVPRSNAFMIPLVSAMHCLHVPVF